MRIFSFVMSAVVVAAQFAAPAVHAQVAATPSELHLSDGYGPPSSPFIPNKPIAIVGGTVIDATGAAPKVGYTVLTEGSIIKKIGPASQVKIPENAILFDATGMTVMPGIVNSNGHVNLDPLFLAPAGDVPLAEMERRWQMVDEASPFRAYVSLMQGVTTIRNTGGRIAYTERLRDQIDAGELPGPRLFFSGGMLISKKSFDAIIARDNPPADVLEFLRNRFVYRVVENLDEDLDKFLASEYSYIKIVFEKKFDGNNDFTDEEVRKIFAKVHAAGKKVDIHSNETQEGYARLLKFDFDTLEHPIVTDFVMDESTIEGFKKKGIISTTLMSNRLAMADLNEDPNAFNETKYIMSMSPERYRRLMNFRDKMLINKANPDLPSVPLVKANMYKKGGPTYNEMMREREVGLENLRRFIKVGAKLSLSTDGTTFMNFQEEAPEANEMRLMVNAGLSPMDTIIAATRHGAEALGMQDKFGTLEPGKYADLIVVPGSPLEDMSVMERVAVVVKGGVRYK